MTPAMLALVTSIKQAHAAVLLENEELSAKYH
jgi:hypothetical protein